jgi:hypothetical protein
VTPWTTHLKTTNGSAGDLRPHPLGKSLVLYIILAAYRKKGPRLTIYQARCANWTGYAADRIRIKRIPGREITAVALTYR